MWKVTLLAIALPVLTVGACGGDESSGLETAPLPTAPDDPSARTFSSEGYSFSHPQDWEWAGEIPPSTGAPLVSQVLLSPGTELELLRVTVTRVPLLVDLDNDAGEVPRRVTADNLDEFAEWRVPQFMRSYEHTREGPSATTVDGLPALYLVVEGVGEFGDEFVSQSVLVFDGETEYAIDCEYAPAKEDDMRPGCAQVFDTFRVD
jgi:hypothetical protein